MTIESSAEFDARLRREAMAWLTVRTNDGLDAISTTDLLDFEIDGRRFRLMDGRVGRALPSSTRPFQDLR
jgi:putative restriction endonuclease